MGLKPSDHDQYEATLKFKECNVFYIPDKEGITYVNTFQQKNKTIISMKKLKNITLYKPLNYIGYT